MAAEATAVDVAAVAAEAKAAVNVLHSSVDRGVRDTDIRAKLNGLKPHFRVTQNGCCWGWLKPLAF